MNTVTLFLMKGDPPLERPASGRSVLSIFLGSFDSSTTSVSVNIHARPNAHPYARQQTGLERCDTHQLQAQASKQTKQFDAPSNCTGRDFAMSVNREV